MGHRGHRDQKVCITKCDFLIVIEKLAAGADVRRPSSLMRGWNFENIAASGWQFLDRERLHRLNDQGK